MASIFIDIASQFTGEKAFKKADSATDKLAKNVKNLGRTLGVTLSVGAVLAFGKAAVKAAAEDEKAQKQLALALKNVGLGRDVAASEEFINKLSREFGVVDDQLRPAYQTLSIATRDSAEAQKLLQLSLDISASTGKDLASVTGALSKAFLGNNTALGKLGVGISKADLKAGKFDDIINQLAKTFKGAAAESVNTFSGKMARLTVSIDNAKEIIGKGLIDSVMILTDSANIEELQTKIEDFATSASENFKKLAGFVKENLTLLKTTAAVLISMFTVSKIAAGVTAMILLIKDVKKALDFLRKSALATAIANMFALNPYGAALQVAAMVALIGLTIKGVQALTDAYDAAGQARDYALDPKKYDNAATAFDKQFKGQEKLIKSAKVLTKQEIATLNAKKLQLAIDKAKLAIGKGDDVFNMEKIQLAAAELNQAQQLGKVTNSAQLLQITNDLARLNVKQSILALEDAIASKDIKAIEAGTAKLNKDLAILGALTNQEVKLRDIESILKDIVPKDLINIANLDEAIAKLKAIGDTKTIVPLGTPTAPSNKPLTPSQVEDLLVLGRTVPVVPDSSGTIGYSGNAGNYASSGFPGSAMGYGAGTSKVEVTVVAPPFTDPNAVAELVNQYLTDAIDRGTLRNLAVA